MNTHDRFWAKVNKHSGIFYLGDRTECWIWTGCVSAAGYGRFQFNGKVGRAHIWRWQDENGTISIGQELDHQCRNKPCVRHLEEVTHTENVRRGAVCRKKARCLRGHAFSAANTYHYRGKQICRLCQRQREQQFLNRP